MSTERKKELAAAEGKAKTESALIPSILKDATSAWTAKAWTGGTSSDFESGLTAHVTSTKKAGEDSVEEIHQAWLEEKDDPPEGAS